MASRAYRRDNQGRFAGSGGGTTVTYGKAGGFANSAFRSKVQAQRASMDKSLGATAGAKGSRRGSSSRRAAIARGLGRAAAGGAVVGLGYRGAGATGRQSVMAGAAYAALAATNRSLKSSKPKSSSGRKVRR